MEVWCPRTAWLLDAQGHSLGHRGPVGKTDAKNCLDKWASLEVNFYIFRH